MIPIVLGALVLGLFSKLDVIFPDMLPPLLTDMKGSLYDTCVPIE
jgi:hypothetical protein